MRRSLFVGSLVVSAALVLTACTSSDSGSESTESSATANASEAPASEAPASEAPASEAPTDDTVAAAEPVCGTTVEEIAAAAQAEGQVNLIALPDTWANYKGILESFRSTYGIEAPVANPDA